MQELDLYDQIKKLYWWDQEIETEIKQRKQKYQKYLNTKADNDGYEHKNQSKDYICLLCQQIDSSIAEKNKPIIQALSPLATEEVFL